MKTKVNEIPLVGPKGRKELLNRINELEAQIAQKDYIRIDIGNYSPDELPAHPDAIQKQINDLIQKGTFLNAVIDDGVDFVRILTCVTEESDGERVATSISYVYDGEIMYVSFDND